MAESHDSGSDQIPAVPPLRRAVGRGLYALETRVARYPVLAQPLARLRGEGVLVDRDTHLLIESFPRCASSFAVAAFELAQEPLRVRVAHHVHTPAHVMVALRLRVPTLVLTREPEPVTISHLIRNPTRTVKDILWGYLRFYEPLIPHLGGFVVGTFDEVVSDFGAVIGRINEHLGTRFREFEHTQANVERCLREIDQEWRRRRGESSLERIVPRPSELRQRLRPHLRARYRAEAPQDLRDRAERVFRQFTADATAGRGA